MPAGHDPPMATLPLMRVVVSGPSMIPTLVPGESVWVMRTRRIRPGDIVVFRDPRGGDLLLVKRAVRREAGGWWLEGEIGGEHLPDSRAFGVVPEFAIVGRVLRTPGASRRRRW